MLPRNSKVNNDGFLVVDYEKYKKEVPSQDEIYWQLFEKFGPVVDTWDDERYFNAWATVCVIGEHTEQSIKNEMSKGQGGI